MAADLQAVAILAQMIGVVDHPGGEPQHLLLEGVQEGELVLRRLCSKAASQCRHGGAHTPVGTTDGMKPQLNTDEHGRRDALLPAIASARDTRYLFCP